MKILLQSKTTRDYVDRGGGWTWKPGRARVFGNGLEAIVFCLDRSIFQMQMVCSFEDQAQNFNVSVTDSR